MVDGILALELGTKFQLMAPVIRGRKGEHKQVFEEIQREGFVRVRVDGQVYGIEDAPKLEKQKKHSIEVVVDRLKVDPKIQKRLADSIETALHLGDGMIIVDVQKSQAPEEKVPGTGHSI